MKIDEAKPRLEWDRIGAKGRVLNRGKITRSFFRQGGKEWAKLESLNFDGPNFLTSRQNPQVR
jgi:hypothetical protein